MLASRVIYPCRPRGMSWTQPAAPLLDNAPMESLFAALKTEHVHQAQFHTRAEARAAVFEYIEAFYNRRRLHSALGYRTPAEARASMEELTMRAAV